MARNKNTGWANDHKLVLAASGGGKSQVVYQDESVPRAGVPHILWDPDEDYPAKRFYTLASFKKGLMKAVRDWYKHGRGYRIALTCDPSPAMFDKFCQIVWSILDGRYRTYLTVEELANVEPSAAKATGWWLVLLNRGRKFGLAITAISQRGTEISKTAYVQLEKKIIGVQNGDDVKRMAKLCSLTPEQIESLKPLQYWVKDRDKTDRIEIGFKPIPQFKWQGGKVVMFYPPKPNKDAKPKPKRQPAKLVA